MSGYHRISKLKSCLSSFNNLRNLKQLNDKISKEINSICSNPKHTQAKILSREFSKITTDIKVRLNGVLGSSNVNVTECQNKVQEGCKSLFNIPNVIEEKRQQYRNKIKKRQIKKEAEKLCQYLSKRQNHSNALVWGAAGLSLTELPESLMKQPDPIPEPPPIPDEAVEALSQLNALGEQTFASLGLGGWTPVGIVQQIMEYLHVNLGLQWWAAVVLATICIRICVFPLVIIAQRNSAKMHNSMPQMQLLQMKMTEARQTGDALNAARYSQEMMVFMTQKGLSPFKNMIVPLAQAPIFISFFMGLRQMANVPVDSLRSGGMFWFTDLTLPDQFFLLPIITSTTLWLTIELGTDGARLASQNMQTMKYVLRAIPVVILPFTVNFPGIILCYWVSSNFISLGQVAFLKIPKVRDYFNIDAMITHNPSDLPVKPKGFAEGLKDSWTNVKITKELEERRRLDEIQFQRAGKGPIQKTYKYDPTKQPTISAKKR